MEWIRSVIQWQTTIQEAAHSKALKDTIYKMHNGLLASLRCWIGKLSGDV